MRERLNDPNRITRGLANAPRNAWYVVAGVDEIGDELLSRRVLDVPLVLYRTSQGEPVALFDRCPHRWMPLSLGSRVGDEIQCRYHGIRIGASGLCTKIPTQDSVPAGMGVHRYLLVDKYPFTWIWMGEADDADPGLIPAPERIKPDHYLSFMFCYPIAADFLLLHENLMDTSHPTFLHEGYFDDGQLTDAKMKVEKEGTVVRLIRDVGVQVPGPATTRFFNLEPGKPVHQITTTETFAPSLNVINYHFSYPDAPERDPVDFIVLAPITPVGPHQCYHFVGSCTSWPSEASEAANELTKEIIRGDQIALEAIEQRRDEMADDDREFNIRSDGASLYLRRLIRSMAESERSAAPCEDR